MFLSKRRSCNFPFAPFPSELPAMFHCVAWLEHFTMKWHRGNSTSVSTSNLTITNIPLYAALSGSLLSHSISVGYPERWCLAVADAPRRHGGDDGRQGQHNKERHREAHAEGHLRLRGKNMRYFRKYGILKTVIKMDKKNWEIFRIFGKSRKNTTNRFPVRVTSFSFKSWLTSTASPLRWQPTPDLNPPPKWINWGADNQNPSSAITHDPFRCVLD